MKENQRLTGAQLLVQCLQNLGVKIVLVSLESPIWRSGCFQMLTFNSPFADRKAAGLQACAWGKLTMAGICFVTRGPGRNGSIGVHSARQTALQ